MATSMMLAENLLNALRDEPDESVDILVLSPPESEVDTEDKVMDIIVEASRVLRPDGTLHAEGAIAEWVLVVEEESDPDFVPELADILTVLGRQDLIGTALPEETPVEAIQVPASALIARSEGIRIAREDSEAYDRDRQTEREQNQHWDIGTGDFV